MKSDHKNTGSLNENITAGSHIPFWFYTGPAPLEFISLKENLETDILIIGGGLAGVTTAYCLAKEGHKVVLLEDGFIGSGETGRTTAHLVTALDERYYNYEKIFNEEKTKLIAESHRTAIDFVEHTIKTENIDCDFKRVNGYLFRHSSDVEDALQKELESTLKAGIETKAILSTPGMLLSKKSLCFMNQAQFHPLKYLEGLCKAILNHGGKIFTNTHASQINNEGATTADGFKVKAKHIVVATNSPVNNLYTMFSKQYAYRTYVIGALVKKDLLPKALWWDTGDFTGGTGHAPYHYVSLQPYNDLYDMLTCGGEDHPTAETSGTHVVEEDRYKLLENWAREYFPIKEVMYRWSGQVLEPMDRISFIGRNPLDHNNVYIITGDSGIGMTHCSFGALLISDLINGRKNKWEELYSPLRFTLNVAGAALKLIKDDLVNVLKKWFYTDCIELSSLKNGEAGIIKLDGKKCGAYRDETGKLFLVSAECTHLKCMVLWNNDEKTWDCPCHGSRFTYEGKVINGPANSDLPAFSEQVQKEVKSE